MEAMASAKLNERGRHEHDSPKRADGLSAMIPGLMALETRCPNAMGVELAADEDGLLNLIVCDEDIDDAMNQLLAARAWARNNLGLLLRAETKLVVPSADRSEDSDASMHLITLEPSESRMIFDTNVRVYSLASRSLWQGDCSGCHAGELVLSATNLYSLAHAWFKNRRSLRAFGSALGAGASGSPWLRPDAHAHG